MAQFVKAIIPPGVRVIKRPPILGRARWRTAPVSTRRGVRRVSQYHTKSRGWKFHQQNLIRVRRG